MPHFDEDDGLVYSSVLSMGDTYNIDECNDLWGNVNVQVNSNARWSATAK